MKKRVLLGVTGASGSVYAERVLEHLLPKVERVYLLFTDAGREVVRHEIRRRENKISLLDLSTGSVPSEQREKIRLLKNDDFFAPVASGSSCPTDMIVLPCSMGTLARVAGGMSTNLLERAADVVLKERKRLVICPREMPLNQIHIQNMLTLAQAGAVIVPPSPAFYQNPETLDDAIDFVAGRILEAIDIEHQLYQKWNARMV